MTALSGPMSRDLTVFDESPSYARVKASAVIHKGSRLTMDTGAARPLTVADTAANYIGIAEESATGGAADGDVMVRYVRNIEEKVSAIGTYTGANVGATVYALDDGTDLSHSNTDRIAIGKITSYQHGKFIFRHATALAPLS